MPIVHHPLEFKIGPLPITGFGIAVMLAFVIAQVISQAELQRRGFQKEADTIPDLILACTTEVEQFLTRSDVDRAGAARRGSRAGRHHRLRLVRRRVRGPA